MVDNSLIVFPKKNGIQSDKIAYRSSDAGYASILYDTFIKNLCSVHDVKR